MNSVDTAIGQGSKEPTPKWRERLKALRLNTPSIIRMVWESASNVVVGNLSARLAAALIPLAMLAVTKLIIDAIYVFLSHHEALPASFLVVGRAGICPCELGNNLASRGRFL